MKIIIAPDSFKESLASMAVAEQIASGFREVFPDADYRLLPIADGGEGTVAALVAATAGRIVSAFVTGPLQEQVSGYYGVTGDGRSAIIEMAAASGLALIPPTARDPMKTTSYGTGELILRALDAGLRHLIIGIGGSATNDCGAGMLQALGVRLLTGDGENVTGCGGLLNRVAHLDISTIDPRLRDCRIDVACDVDSPLTGPKGASTIFGPQKGATLEMVKQLDANLAHFAELIARDMGQDVAARPGSGAAGGMGAALLALGAELRPGIDIVSEVINLEEALKDADLVITGEGRIDGQTVHGKAPMGVACLAKRYGIPVVGIAGCLGKDAHLVHAKGIDAVFSVIGRPCSLPEAFAEAAENIQSTARNIAATIKLSRTLSY